MAPRGSRATDSTCTPQPLLSGSGGGTCASAESAAPSITPAVEKQCRNRTVIKAWTAAHRRVSILSDFSLCDRCDTRTPMLLLQVRDAASRSRHAAAEL